MKQIKLVAFMFVVACGSGAKKAPEPPAADPTPPPATDSALPVAETKQEPAPAPAPPPPPPPKVSKAKASLAMVSGAKVAPANIVFTETEGQAAVSVTSESWFVGLKPGKYHLVIHTGAECGKNAKSIGKAWDKSAAVSLDFEVTKDSAGNIDAGVPLKVEGADTVSGHTLVLFDDKKGKAGKAIACGPITVDAGAPAASPPG